MGLMGCYFQWYQVSNSCLPTLNNNVKIFLPEEESESISQKFVFSDDDDDDGGGVVVIMMLMVINILF
jgi:hypothetical protein